MVAHFVHFDCLVMQLVVADLTVMKVLLESQAEARDAVLRALRDCL